MRDKVNKAGAFIFAAMLLFGGGCGVVGRSVKTELYFGMLRGNGRVVSEREWERFVEEEVGPRFTSGFTIVEAKGQWVGKEEEVIKEKTKIIIFVHREGGKAERAIEEVREKYKEQFLQEEVLRISSYTRVD